MTHDPGSSIPIFGWVCGKCGGRNQPEDRYCGECGGAHDPPSAEPAPSLRSTVSGILPEVVTPAPGLLQGVPVILSGLAAAALFGALYHFAARVRDLKILFPILLGLGVGWAVRVAAIRLRCHRGALLIGTAIVAGIAAYGMRQALDTIQLQNLRFQRLTEEARDQDLIEGRKTVIRYGFLDALRDRAAAGVAFDFGRRSESNALRGVWFWLFLIVETALVAGIAAASVRLVSRHAFCHLCRAFIPSVAVFRVNARDSDRLVHAIRKQRWKLAQELSGRASASPTDRAEALLLRCAACNSSSIRVDVYEGRRFKKVMHAALPPEALEGLARAG